MLAAAIDAGIEATAALGDDILVLAHQHHHNSIPYHTDEGNTEPLTIVGAVALFYALVSRRSGTGRTAGERLLEVRYQRSGQRHGTGATRARPEATADRSEERAGSEAGV